MNQYIDRQNYVYLDLGFYAPCNFTCSYCRKSLVKGNDEYELGSLIEQLSIFLLTRRAAVFKVSGYGEITLWKHFPEMLKIVTTMFPAVQIISNGSFGSSTLDAMLNYRNVSPNITLDGSTIDANRLRTNSPIIHARILDNIKSIIKSGRGLEINTVLHKYNSTSFYTLLEFLSELNGNGKVTVFPMPVRQFERAPEEWLKITVNCDVVPLLKSAWNDFPNLLPHKSYLDDLICFLNGNLWPKKCKIHWANIGTGSNDELLHCANYGNQLSYGPSKVELSKRQTEKAVIKLGHLFRGGVGEQCKTCFNHYQILNNWLDYKISIPELMNTPSLSFEGIDSVLFSAEDEWRKQSSLVLYE